MSPVKTVVVTREDGTVETLNISPVVAHTATEVDVVMEDGSTKVFVPKPDAQ
jgi:hypothetical protein